MLLIITSVCLKNFYFESLIKKGKDKAFEVFDNKEFTLVNDCFIPIAIGRITQNLPFSYKD